MKGVTTPSSDGRTAILLAPAERDFVLGEMRRMLVSVQRISAALAENNGAGVASAARAAASHEGAEPPTSLMAKLPMEFKRTGMAMHGAFGELAEAAERGEPVAKLQAKLADNLNACVGCHESYRIDPAK
jgi:cytochrome c556